MPKPEFSDTTSPITGIRIGVVRHFYESDLPCELDVASATEDAIAVLADLGAIVKDVSIEPFQTSVLLPGRFHAPRAMRYTSTG